MSNGIGTREKGIKAHQNIIVVDPADPRRLGAIGNPDAERGFDYRHNPPTADGRKVILTDTDHLWGIGGDVPWVWKSFLRGLNPLFMDPYKQDIPFFIWSSMMSFMDTFWSSSLIS